MVSLCNTIITEENVDNITEGKLSCLIYYGRVHRFEWRMNGNLGDREILCLLLNFRGNLVDKGEISLLHEQWGKFVVYTSSENKGIRGDHCWRYLYSYFWYDSFQIRQLNSSSDSQILASKSNRLNIRYFLLCMVTYMLTEPYNPPSFLYVCIQIDFAACYGTTHARAKSKQNQSESWLYIQQTFVNWVKLRELSEICLCFIRKDLGFNNLFNNLLNTSGGISIGKWSI